MQFDLTQIILAVITLMGSVVTSFIIPLLKQKLTEKQQETLLALIKTGVYAAEQLKDTGSDKKEYVKQLLAEKGYDADLNEIDAAVEAAVKELKIELSK